MSRISKLGRFLLSLSLVAGSFALAPKMHAQQGDIKVSVPFAFSADDQKFDAGLYEIRALNPFVLLVSNTATHQSRTLQVSDRGLRDIQSNGRLVFHRYNGSEYYLYQVWMPGRNDFGELRTTQQEQQMMRTARSTSSSGTVVEALATPVQ
jgi:hypothetical protein